MWQDVINDPALRDKWGKAWTEWEAMRVLVRVVEAGSFVRASEKLELQCR
jgi:hypothetical protein